MISNSTREFFDRVLLGKYIELKCEIIDQPERLSGLESEMTMRQSEPDDERSGDKQK